MLKTILLLEDDPLQAETFRKTLMQRYREANVIHIECESEMSNFADRAACGETPLPDIVIADVMVPWSLPSPNSPAEPPEVKAGGYARAGIRCLRRFRQLLGGAVPWILLTILGRDSIAKEAGAIENTGIVNKEQPMQELIAEIDRLMTLSALRTP